MFPLKVTGGTRLIVVGQSNGSTVDCSLLNSSAPVIYASNSSLTIYNVTFKNCGWSIDASPGASGSVLSAINSSVALLYCRFINTTAALGGAVSLRHGSLLIRGCAFIDCSARPRAGDALGGCVSLQDVSPLYVGSTSFVRGSSLSVSSDSVAAGGCLSIQMHAQSSAVAFVTSTVGF
jgi:hypothetical protein